ncbi:putative disease resistance protein At1g50180 [Capsicum annuum]|uniref:putative disease resistance protein At1g50180 n=1 Tax=Capsicum annuum TaxID=4072 RepID=UPI001FB124AE|nr:putative disease resistance protein At1g50180 [Capsicum annuum]
MKNERLDRMVGRREKVDCTDTRQEEGCSSCELRVDQDYDEKEVLVKIFNHVTGSALKFSEDIDVADMLRRQLFGKRILLMTRQKEVAFHGKGNTDSLNLRLLKLEESWELLEIFPDELLEVGKEIAQNCKGLPLVVDLISGVIVGREKTKSVWLEV